MNPDPSSINEASDKVRLFFILMSAVLIIGIAASYFAGRAALDAIAGIREFDAAIEAIQDLRSTVQDAETGQRGYLLTRRANYLAPMRKPSQPFSQRLQAAEKLAKAGLLPAKQVSELERSINAKIEELRKTVSLVQSGRIPAAMEIVRSDEGERTMESIRTIIAEIVSGQENGRAAASERADAAIQFRGWVFLCGYFPESGIFVVGLSSDPQGNDASFRCESGNPPAKGNPGRDAREHRGCGDHHRHQGAHHLPQSDRRKAYRMDRQGGRGSSLCGGLSHCQ